MMNQHIGTCPDADCRDNQQKDRLSGKTAECRTGILDIMQMHNIQTADFQEVLFLIQFKILYNPVFDKLVSSGDCQNDKQSQYQQNDFPFLMIQENSGLAVRKNGKPPF